MRFASLSGATFARGSRAAAWIVAASSALPLVVCFPAPLTDWPNHIARVWIGVRLLHHDPFWMRFYALNPRLVPNLALDLGIGALHFAGLDVDIAAAIFLVLSLVVFALGFRRFARAMGSDDFTKPMLGATLFLTGPVMYGLVNYVLGIGVALALLGAWADCAADARRRWPIAIGGALALFPIHLLASAIFVLVMGCMDAWSWRVRLPRDLRALLQSSSSVAGGATFVGLLLASPSGGGNLPRADGANLWFPGHGHLIPTLWWKGGIFLRMFADHATIPAAATTLIGIAAVIACALFGRASGAARQPISVPRGGAWLAVFVLLFAVLAIPESIGSGSLLDYRIALAPLTIAAATIRLDGLRRLARRVAAVAIALVCLARGLSFAADFHSEAAAFRSIDAAAATLPAGGMVLTARGLADDEIPQRVWWSPPLEHGAARAVFAGQFVPTIFAIESQQPVVLKPEFARWRRGWRLASEGEIAIFAHDVAPLCQPPAPWHGKVMVFVAYPGRFATATDVPGVREPLWALLDACSVKADRE